MQPEITNRTISALRSFLTLSKHVMAPGREGQWPSGAALATLASIGFVHLFQSFAARAIAGSKKDEACSRELLHRIGFSTWFGSPRSCRSSNAVNPI
jgi:hypothetical protein